MEHFKAWLDELQEKHALPEEGWLYLLQKSSAPFREEAAKRAEALTLKHFGNRIFVRGIVEFSNYCSNDCFYCGIRKSNKLITRYNMSDELIVEC